MIEISSQKDSRYAYREILQGYSHIEEENFYIKHFKESDLGFVDTVYKKCIDSCKKKGLLSREEKLTLYKKEDLIDERSGDFYNVATDVAYLLPMVELCGCKERIVRIPDILLILNRSNPNQASSNLEHQKNTEAIIRSRKAKEKVQ